MKKITLLHFLLLICLVVRSIPTHAQIITTYVACDTTHGFSGDGGPATAAHLYRPCYTYADKFGNIYVSDGQNFRVRKVDVHGIITTIAGTGTQGYTGDGGQATNAELTPYGVATDLVGNIFIVDPAVHVVRKINTSGIISTIAGTGHWGFSGDGGPATNAEFGNPESIAIAMNGTIYISDIDNDRIRKIDTNGIISTIAGTGTSGFSGDGGPATLAKFAGPYGIAVDCHGNMYIDDYFNFRIRKVDTAGIITTIAGHGSSGFSGDGGAATNAMLNHAEFPCVDINNNVYIADVGNLRVRQISPRGIINTVSGSRYSGYSGDGGPATNAKLQSPVAVSTDGYSLYITDINNNNIRKVTYPAYQVGAIAGDSALCSGSAITLTDTSAGGFWSVGHSRLDTVSSTGMVTGIAAGTDSVFYHVLDACMDTLTASHFITINPLPVAGPITGPATICVEVPVNLHAGGTGSWAVTDSTLALINPTTGLVTSSHAGTDTILYLVTTVCGTDTARFPIQIQSVPTAGTIDGADSLCPGDTVTLTDAAAGGVWGSLNTRVATSLGSGKIRAMVAGADTVTYTVRNGCGADTASKTVLVRSADECNTGISPLFSENTLLTIFPNPNNGSFTVAVPGNIADNSLIIIYNSLGQVVAQFSAAAGEPAAIETRLKPGIYLLEARAGAHSYQKLFTIM